MLVEVVEVVALAHGVHFLHLLTLVLPTVSCGSYPGLSGSPVIPKPLSRDPSQGKNKCCFWNFLLKDDQPCRQVCLVHLVLVQVCLVHRHNLPVVRLWSVFTNTFAPQVEMEMRWNIFHENLRIMIFYWLHDTFYQGGGNEIFLGCNWPHRCRRENLHWQQVRRPP